MYPFIFIFSGGKYNDCPGEGIGGSCNVAHVIRTLNNRDPIRISCAMAVQLISILK